MHNADIFFGFDCDYGTTFLVARCSAPDVFSPAHTSKLPINLKVFVEAVFYAMYRIELERTIPTFCLYTLCPKKFSALLLQVAWTNFDNFRSKMQNQVHVPLFLNIFFLTLSILIRKRLK